MSKLRKFQPWLSVVCSIQLGALLVADVILARRLGAISRGLHESLYASGVAVEQVDKVDQTLFSIFTGAHWLMLWGMTVSIFSFGLLLLMSKKSLSKQKPTSPEMS